MIIMMLKEIISILQKADLNFNPVGLVKNISDKKTEAFGTPIV
jgi:hypothetical protein